MLPGFLIADHLKFRSGKKKVFFLSFSGQNPDGFRPGNEQYGSCG